MYQNEKTFFVPEYKNVFSFCTFELAFILMYQNVLSFCCTRIQKRLFVLFFRIGFYFNVSKRPFVSVVPEYKNVLSFCCTYSFCTFELAFILMYQNEKTFLYQNTKTSFRFVLSNWLLF